ncbi:MAG: GIY-YIG nuclease family protein [bacterium]|nr:GIY-YIG nuclease family protein [bacterium]
MQYSVYVLKSLKNNKFYIGSTGNIDRRVKEHNSGKSKYTRPGKPYVLVYSEQYLTRSEAVKREWYFKNTADGNRWLKEKLAIIKT